MTAHPLLVAAAPYVGGTWRYGRNPRVAHPWPAGVRGPSVARVAADQEIDCSTLTASLIMHAYPSASWKQEHYAAMQVFDAAVPDSPIRAVVAVGVGERVDAFTWARWHLVQGWRRLPGHPDGPSGHAILVYDRGGGTLDVLESTSRENMRGPRMRTTTADKLRAEFPAALYIARLIEPKAV